MSIRNYTKHDKPAWDCYFFTVYFCRRLLSIIQVKANILNFCLYKNLMQQELKQNCCRSKKSLNIFFWKTVSSLYVFYSAELVRQSERISTNNLATNIRKASRQCGSWTPYQWIIQHFEIIFFFFQIKLHNFYLTSFSKICGI